MARAGTAPSVAAKKTAAPRRRKVPAPPPPPVAPPEVMSPVVALDEIDAMTILSADTAEKKKDKPRVKKQKLVRDSFTMPEEEYAALGEMKKACLRDGVEVKKSELLRVAVSLLRKMDVPQLQQALAELTPVKAGRPSKQK
jgi:hypothetical protein